MLDYTLRIPENSPNAKALLDYLRSLDFAEIIASSTGDTILTENQKQELDNRLATATEKDFISLEEANAKLNLKYGL